MTIARDERIVLELGSQTVWQFPTSLEKKSSWLCTNPNRSLTNFSVWIVPRSIPRMFVANWRMIVIGVSGGMNCCPPVDMGSSSTKNRTTPFTPTIPARKSRTCTTLAVRRCHIHGHYTVLEKSIAPSQCTDEPTASCLTPMSVKPRAGPKIKPIDASDQSCTRPKSWKHHQTM